MGENMNKEELEEQRIDRLIMNSLFLNNSEKRVLFNGDLLKKNEWIKNRRKKIMFFATIVAIFVFLLWHGFLPEKSKPVEPTKITVPAGVIENIELHSTTFSEETTVTTSQGIYQVKGGVSASLGDVVVLEKWRYKDRKFSEQTNTYKDRVCVESEINNRCYPLMR